MFKNYKDAVTIILGVISVTGSFVFVEKLLFFYNNFDIRDLSVGEVSRAFNTILGEKSFNFGKVNNSVGFISHNFELKNNNTSPIFISRIYTSCGCLSARIFTNKGVFGPFDIQNYFNLWGGGVVVGVGEKFIVEATLYPGKIGPVPAGIVDPRIVLNGRDGGNIILRVSALIFP